MLDKDSPLRLPLRAYIHQGLDLPLQVQLLKNSVIHIDPCSRARYEAH